MSTNRRPLVIAHRGVSGRALENSMAAFRLAVAEECDGIELDIHTTADGALVVHHDPVLPNGDRIGAIPLEQARSAPLPDGSVVPTLEEVLAATGSLEIYIEAKSLPESADSHLLELIAADHQPRRLHLHAFDHRIISRLARREPALSLGVLSSSYPVHPLEQLRAAGATTLWQEWQLIDQALVDECGREGIEVIAWTVNSAERAAEFAGMGVAGLCGNWPERIRRGITNVKGAP